MHGTIALNSPTTMLYVYPKEYDREAGAGLTDTATTHVHVDLEFSIKWLMTV